MISVQEEVTVSISELIDIDALWQAAIGLGFPAAIWKLPFAKEIKLLISANKSIKHCQPEFEKMSPGFVISPFIWEERQNIQFMEGDIIVTYYESGKLAQIENRLGEEHPTFKKLISLALSQTVAKNETTTPRTFFNPVVLENQTVADRFKRAVEIAVLAIKQNQFNKVVLSRTKELEVTNAFEPIKGFRKLAGEYPHAFVSMVNLPDEKQIWMGASPELLVQQKANGIFKTMSLAGTQASKDLEGNLLPKYDIRWGGKEIEEQALVSRYIVECFKKIRLREYMETGPKTVLAGNLYHLQTNFEVDTNEHNFPELPSVMIKLLHPTSAICGTPKEPSLDFLTQIEGYDRSYYSGFLGPVQVDGETNIYVNLRTVRIQDNRATFYAGAGITEDSDPESEWNETEMKCDTVLQVISQY